MFSTVLAWALAQASGTHARTLADAYTGGTLRVSFEGRTVEYRSIAELERALTALYQAQATPRRRPAYTIARLGDGWA